MTRKEKIIMIDKIIERGIEKHPELKKDRLSIMMDIESADKQFDMRLSDWFNADDENFFHDFIGIINESNRETFPATFGIFVPRYAGQQAAV